MRVGAHVSGTAEFTSTRQCGLELLYTSLVYAPSTSAQIHAHTTSVERAWVCALGPPQAYVWLSGRAGPASPLAPPLSHMRPCVPWKWCRKWLVNLAYWPFFMGLCHPSVRLWGMSTPGNKASLMCMPNWALPLAVQFHRSNSKSGQHDDMHKHLPHACRHVGQF